MSIGLLTGYGLTRAVEAAGGTFNVVTGQRTFTTTADVVDYPAGTAENDLLFLFYVTGATQSARDPGTPTGWTSRFSFNYIGHNRVYTRQAGTETSVTIPATTFEADLVYALVQVPAAVNINASNPWSFASGTMSDNTTTSVATPIRTGTARRFGRFSMFNKAVTSYTLDSRLELVADVQHVDTPEANTYRPWLVLGWDGAGESMGSTGYTITADANTYKYALQAEVVNA